MVEPNFLSPADAVSPVPSLLDRLTTRVGRRAATVSGADEPGAQILMLPLAARVRAGETRAAAWLTVASLAAPLLLLSTIFWSILLRWSVEDQVVLLRARLAPIVAAHDAAESRRAAIASAGSSETASALIERVARALPGDASLWAVAREQKGGTTIEIETADPDRLRPALRQSGLMAGLREAAQGRSDRGIRVTLRGTGL